MKSLKVKTHAYHINHDLTYMLLVNTNKLSSWISQPLPRRTILFSKGLISLVELTSPPRPQWVSVSDVSVLRLGPPLGH